MSDKLLQDILNQLQIANELKIIELTDMARREEALASNNWMGDRLNRLEEMQDRVSDISFSHAEIHELTKANVSGKRKLAW